jgi:hypothetical protein
MAEHTNIAYCDSSINLEMGCDGCELWNAATGVRKCYAGMMTERRKGQRGWPEAFNRPKLFLGRLEEALSWRSSRLVYLTRTAVS